MFFIISIGKEIKKVLLTKKKKLVSNDRYKNIVLPYKKSHLIVILAYPFFKTLKKSNFLSLHK